jgi:endonuclease/exonuclease/phosphatase (EEP) superfamily protein YafD
MVVPPINWFARGVLLICTTLVCLAWFPMFGSVFSSWHAVLDLFCHTSWHCFFGLTAIGAVIVVGRLLNTSMAGRWNVRLWLCVVPWSYFLFVVQPWTSLALTKNDPSASGLKIYSWNFLISNSDMEDVMRHVRKQNADVVALIEMGEHQVDALKELSKDYAYHVWIPDGAAGVAILSKVPNTTFEVLDLGGVGMPAVEVSLPANEKCKAMRLLAVHTRSPRLHPMRTKERDRQLNAIGEWAAKVGTSYEASYAVVGDLNITPWSRPFHQLLRSGKLRDSRWYRGYYGSWPAPLRFFGIPIDHFLASDQCDVLYRDVDPYFGLSDHRPIVAIVK